MQTWLRKNAELPDFRISKENRAQLTAARKAREKSDVLEDQMDKRAVRADIQSAAISINADAARPENRIATAGPDVGRPKVHGSATRDKARAGFAVPASLAGYRLRTSLGLPRGLAQVNAEPYEPPSEEEEVPENDRPQARATGKVRLRPRKRTQTREQMDRRNAARRLATAEAGRARGSSSLDSSVAAARKAAAQK